MNSWKKLLPFFVMSVVVTGGISTYLMRQHQQQINGLYEQHRLFKKSVEPLLNKKQKIVKKGSVGNQAVRPRTEKTWVDIQKKVHNTVVQVFAYVSEFNWLEPYKAPRQGEGAGTGFFINDKGDFVTNYHVIAQASSVQIQIPSFGRERFDAEVVGVSPERDIALLNLTAEAREKIIKKLGEITFLTLGDSDDVVRSQEVLALGYPLGQSRLKTTLGIVSGRERLGYFGYFQVDTPLNPGNSGGPALNAAGKVIGINSMGVPSAQNVGFIIPVNEVTTAINDLYKVQLLRKPTLGCIFTYATEEMVNYLGNPIDGGWYIAKVFGNTLLQEVGIQKDDMLYEVNGHSVDMHGEMNVPWSEDKVSLFELMNRYTVGDELKFLVYRKGKPMQFDFKLKHRYLPPIRNVYPEFEKEATEYEIIGGMVVMELRMNHIATLIQHMPSLVKYARPEKQHEPALIITHVFQNSQADKARVLRVGSIIDEINDTKVTTLAEFRRAIIKNKEKDYLTVRMTDNLYGVLSLQKVINDEDAFASRYFYAKSSLVEALAA